LTMRLDVHRFTRLYMGAIAPNHSTHPTAFDRSISRAFAAQRTNSGQRLKIGAFVW